MSLPKLGVVLFQLGGPDSPEAVEPFLYNLFRDPDIIDFPFARIAREPLARLIASRRARHVAHHYAEIGGCSPILENTRRQAEALERELSRDYDARVAIAMRYWRPFTREAVAEMERHAPGEVVLLPLYPQYSKTTTGSALNEWRRQFTPNGWSPRVRVIEEYHEHPAYIEAVTAAIDACLDWFPDPAEVDMVFSAHSVPLAVIEAGDPYQRQI
ncbi:MAG: ferrochelatase, partial [Bryobacteraceae bacterium]